MTEKSTPVSHVIFALILMLGSTLGPAIGCNCTQSVAELDGFYAGDVVTYKDNDSYKQTIVDLDRRSRQACISYMNVHGDRSTKWVEVDLLKKVGEESHETIDLNARVMLGETELPCTRVQGVYYVDPQQVQFIPHPHTVVAPVSQPKDNSWKTGDLVQFRVDAVRTMIVSRMPHSYNESIQCSWQLPDGSVQRQEFMMFELERVNSFEDDADLLAYNLQD